MVFRTETGATPIVATGLATGITAAGTGLAGIETEGENLTICEGIRLWAGTEDEQAPIVANVQANTRNRLKRPVLPAAIMNQGYSDARVMPTHRRASSRTGPKVGPNVLRMETIHIMDFIFSIRQHLMAYRGAASLGNADRQGTAMDGEMADDRNLLMLGNVVLVTE